MSDNFKIHTHDHGHNHKIRSSSTKEKKRKWYFGGIAGAGAACVTHPLDLLKVQMQTQKGRGITVFQIAGNIVREQGIRGLYNGISASILRQLTYSTTRFGLYDVVIASLTKDGSVLPFYKIAGIAAMSGLAGGLVGSPTDLVNVRMQNDIKLPPEQRRNYKNVIHGLYMVGSKEGVGQLWAGASMTCSRAALMTLGQVAFYDLVKGILFPYLGENVVLHMTSSTIAGGIATILTQPVDVLKTRAMNAKPGEYNGVLDVVRGTLKEGPFAFLKGVVPAFVRIAPHTILTFVFLEQLKKNLG